MTRTIDFDTRISRAIECVVWNAAAGALLAILILVLLGSLRVLDVVSPRPDPPAVSASGAIVDLDRVEGRVTEGLAPVLAE